MYSKEDIEKKRQQALQRKSQKAFTNSLNKESITISKNSLNNRIKQFKITNSGSSSKPLFNNYANSSSTSNSTKFSAFNKFKSKSQTTNKFKSSASHANPVGDASKFYGSQQICEVTCIMISSTRFSADMSIFSPQLIDLFKSIPSKLYDPQTKLWSFLIQDYESVTGKVTKLSSNFVLKGLPTFLLKTFKNVLSEEKEPSKNINLSELDKTLINSLYPFQKEGIEYGISMNGRCLIADDMGLGKTRQALGIALYYKKNWPLIIVAPSSMRYQWLEAVLTNIPSVPVQSIQHIVSTKDYIENSKVIILSYDLLARKIDELTARKYGVVICDESHYLKSAKTQRTKAVQRLVANSQHVILLTGTPALSRPIELHSQIKLLIPNFMSYQDFGLRYCAGVRTNFGWDFNGSSNLKELEILLKACCMIRRLKSEVMRQLPSKIRQKVILDPHLIKDATKEMEAASKNLEKHSLSGHERKKALLEFYAETSRAKEKAVCNYISDFIENGEKFLIFAHHQNMLDAISNLLTSKKILFIRIDGKTKPEQRKQFVDIFQEDKKVLVAVLSITAANAGITMTSAKLVIFAELTWNPGILSQAEDRVHRIGQTDNVVIRYLLAKHTADDHLWPGIQKKIDVLNEVGLDQNFDLNELDVSKQSQSLGTQQTLENYFEKSPNTSLSNSLSPNKSGNAVLEKNSESLKQLLDMDDDAFNDIDLNDIV